MDALEFFHTACKTIDPQYHHPPPRSSLTTVIFFDLYWLTGNTQSTGSYLLISDALHRQKLVEFLISKQEVL